MMEMPRYKEIFIKKGITQNDLVQQLQEIDKRMDKSMVSKIVNFVVLPTPKIAQKICEVLECEILDIYQLDELVSDSLNLKQKNQFAENNKLIKNSV